MTHEITLKLSRKVGWVKVADIDVICWASLSMEEFNKGMMDTMLD